MTAPNLETRFAGVFFTDIVGSTDLKARHGVPAYTRALIIHNTHFERIAHECNIHKIHLTTRVGIHAGEVTEIPIKGGSDIVAPAADPQKSEERMGK